MTDRDRELAIVIRKALRKKKAYGLLPVMRDATLSTLYPHARRFLKKIADRRLVARKGVWVGTSEYHVWVSMNDYILELDERRYLSTIETIISSNVKQGYITDEECNDSEDYNRD